MVSDRGVGPLMSGPCVSGEDVLVQKGRPVEKKRRREEEGGCVLAVKAAGARCLGERGEREKTYPGGVGKGLGCRCGNGLEDSV